MPGLMCTVSNRIIYLILGPVRLWEPGDLESAVPVTEFNSCQESHSDADAKDLC